MFKPGDIVTCVDDLGVRRTLVKGRTYTVDSASESDVRLKECLHHRPFKPSRFELKKGDEVICLEGYENGMIKEGEKYIVKQVHSGLLGLVDLEDTDKCFGGNACGWMASRFKKVEKPTPAISQKIQAIQSEQIRTGDEVVCIKGEACFGLEEGKKYIVRYINAIGTLDLEDTDKCFGTNVCGWNPNRFKKVEKSPSIQIVFPPPQTINILPAKVPQPLPQCPICVSTTPTAKQKEIDTHTHPHITHAQSFSKGDIVTCTEGNGITLITGNTYVVKDARGFYLDLEDNDTCSGNLACGWDALRFEKKITFQSGDRVTCIKDYEKFRVGDNALVQNFATATCIENSDTISCFDSCDPCKEVSNYFKKTIPVEKLSPGDEVVCVIPYAPHLVKGRKYTVEKIVVPPLAFAQRYQVILKNNPNSWYATRFDKVVTEFSVGDKVKYVGTSNNNFKQGEIYTIKNLPPPNFVEFEGMSSISWLRSANFSKNFIKVPTLSNLASSSFAAKVSVGDKVKYVGTSSNTFKQGEIYTIKSTNFQPGTTGFVYIELEEISGYYSISHFDFSKVSNDEKLAKLKLNLKNCICPPKQKTGFDLLVNGFRKFFKVKS